MKTTVSFIKLLWWSFVFSLLSVLLLYILHLSFPDFIQSRSDFSSKNTKDFSNISIWRILIDACLLAPLVEESVFRLNLSKKIKHHYLSIAVAFIFLILTLVNSNYYNGFVFIIYACLVFLVFKITQENYPQKLMLFVSSVAFGLIHIDQISSSLVLNSFSYLVYTLPFMVLGYFFGLIRIKHGIMFAILAHFLKNALAMYFIFK